SLPLQLLLARVMLHSRDYSNAIAIMTSLLETDETFYIARRYRAQAHLLAGDPEKAITDLQLLPQERSEDPSFRLPMLARAYADMGETQRAEEVFERLLSMARTDYVVSWNLAIVAAGLGRLEEAMAYLEAAYEQRESTLAFLKSLPWFAALVATPRFRTLLMKTGPVL
ncbi:MAG: tetratricopeptide repeat protein, partial [Candidatus Cybelea sp.]